MSPENSQAGAKAYEALLRGRLARGEPLEASTKPVAASFAVFAEEWFRTHVMTNNKPSTQRSTRMLLDGHLLAAFGKKPIDQIVVEDIERYKMSKLQAGISPKTVNNHVGVLGKCLRTAVEWGRAVSAPRPRMLKVPPQRFDFLNPLESSQLVAAIIDPRWRAMIVCALRAGLRQGELHGLRWEDIDFERWTLSVRQSIVRGIVGSPKNNKVRHIPLAADLMDALAVLKPKTGYVFQQDNGEPMTRGMAWRALQSATKRAGLRSMGWHVLRHTFASQLATKGVSIQVIQTLLGHSDLKMTLRYAHLAPSTLRDAIDVLQAEEKTETEDFGQPVGNTFISAFKISSGNETVLQTLLR